MNRIDEIRKFYSNDYILIEIEDNDTLFLFRTTDKDVYYRRCNGNESHLCVIPISFFRRNSRLKVMKIQDQKKWWRFFDRFYPTEFDFTVSQYIIFMESNIWTKVTSKKFYSFDHTKHALNCEDPFLLNHVPIISDEEDLVCASCGASIDLEWYPWSTYKTNELYSMWENWQNDYYMEWIPEEVLQDIIPLLGFL